MQQTFTPRLNLAGAVFPQTGLLRDALLVLACTGLMALSAQVTIRLLPVPITGQTFVVLLTGAALGRTRGVAVMLAYIAEGLAGLPVFANTASAWTPNASFGVPAIMGPTAGYLAGFVAAAFVTGWLAEKGWDRVPWRWAVAMLLGNLAIYVPGLLVLQSFVGPDRVFALGLQPFLVGDILKLLLAAAALPAVWRFLARRSTSPDR